VLLVREPTHDRTGLPEEQSGEIELVQEYLEEIGMVYGN
jgi:hypothetical protein